MTRSSSLDATRRSPSATKPLNTKTLPHNPKKFSIYLQTEPSTTPSEEPPGDIEEATNPDELTHLTMIHKSLSQQTEDASEIYKVLSINCHVNVHHTYRFAHCLDVVTQHGFSNPALIQMLEFFLNMITLKYPRHKLMTSLLKLENKLQERVPDL